MEQGPRIIVSPLKHSLVSHLYHHGFYDFPHCSTNDGELVLFITSSFYQHQHQSKAFRENTTSLFQSIVKGKKAFYLDFGFQHHNQRGVLSLFGEGNIFTTTSGGYTQKDTFRRGHFQTMELWQESFYVVVLQ